MAGFDDEQYVILDRPVRPVFTWGWTGPGSGLVPRFCLDGTVASAAGRDFPLGTLAVNLSGASLIRGAAAAALGYLARMYL
jgi:fluoride ion exporter CrcB/FEX